MGAELEKGRNLWAETSEGQIRKGPKPLATGETYETKVRKIYGKVNRTPRFSFKFMKQLSLWIYYDALFFFKNGRFTGI